jgi:hypothetical protein
MLLLPLFARHGKSQQTPLGGSKETHRANKELNLFVA